MNRTQTSHLWHSGIAAAAVALLFAASVTAQSVPLLINYQGRFTDQTGAALVSGQYAVQFRLWDDPLLANSSDLIWGQQQNVILQSNGIFNVILGSPGAVAISGVTPAVNSLAYAFAGTNCFLGLTIVLSNGVTVASPSEILPRQQLLTVPFAITAANAAVATTAGIANSVVPGAIGSQQIAQGGIQTSNLASGIVTLANLAPRQISTNAAGIGGIAFSQSSGNSTYSLSSSSEIPVPSLSVTLITSGRPVHVFLSSVQPTPPLAGITDQNATLGVWSGGQSGNVFYNIYRGTNLISRNQLAYGFGAPYISVPVQINIPPSSIQVIDSPPAGTNSYSFTVSGTSVYSQTFLQNVQRVALEL